METNYESARLEAQLEKLRAEMGAIRGELKAILFFVVAIGSMVLAMFLQMGLPNW